MYLVKAGDVLNLVSTVTVMRNLGMLFSRDILNLKSNNEPLLSTFFLFFEAWLLDQFVPGSL